MGLLDRLFGRKESSADDVIEIMDDAIEFAARNWIHFNTTLPFKDSVTIQEKIMSFSIPAIEGLKGNFAALENAPDPIYLVIIAKGVERSGTHSKSEIEQSLGLPLP